MNYRSVQVSGQPFSGRTSLARRVAEELNEVLRLMGVQAMPHYESPSPTARNEMSSLELHAYHLNNSGIQ